MTVYTSENFNKVSVSRNTDMEVLGNIFNTCPNLKMSFSRNSNADGRNGMGYGYKVTLANTENGNKFSVTYNNCVADGGRTPDINNMLWCILMDGRSYENSRDFSDFCLEFGYDEWEDRRNALRVYQACERTYNNLSQIFTDEELEKLDEVFEDF